MNFTARVRADLKLSLFATLLPAVHRARDAFRKFKIM